MPVATKDANISATAAAAVVAQAIALAEAISGRQWSS